MTINWESIAIFCLSGVIAVCAYILRRLIKSVDRFGEDLIELGTKLAVTGEWRDGHDKRHLEIHDILTGQRREIWDAIDKIRDKK